MDDDQLRQRYLDYLDVLNSRRLDELADYLADPVVHNDRSFSWQQYRDMIADDVAHAPDLTYRAEILVVAGGRVGCRLFFECTPPGEFLGLPVDGRRLRFAEHVFYEFRDGRIASVSSLIDRAGIADQLRAGDA